MIVSPVQAAIGKISIGLSVYVKVTGVGEETNTSIRYLLLDNPTLATNKYTALGTFVVSHVRISVFPPETPTLYENSAFAAKEWK
jgi:hypothetical protein